jgi:hypothetical protein
LSDYYLSALVGINYTEWINKIKSLSSCLFSGGKGRRQIEMLWAVLRGFTDVKGVGAQGQMCTGCRVAREGSSDKVTPN